MTISLQYKIVLITLVLVVSLAANYDCEFYIVPSKTNGVGRAVIAGASFDVGHALNSNPTITIHSSLIESWQLFNYVYESDKEHYSLIAFGLAMLFNHISDEEEHLYHFWIGEPLDNATSCGDKISYLDHRSTYNHISFETVRPISQYNEIFKSYGGKEWFVSRGIPFEFDTHIDSYNQSDIDESGHCASNIYIAESYLPLAGLGLYSSIRYSKGDIVTISPVIVIPYEELKGTSSSSVLINYCIAHVSSKIALLPIGLAAMANHQSDRSILRGGGGSNMKIQWFEWKEGQLAKTLTTPASELLGSFSAPLDIKYIATRDIEAGEELTIDYGTEWLAAWASYLAEANSLITEELKGERAAGTCSPDVSFRHPIGTNGLEFPAHWKA